LRRFPRVAINDIADEIISSYPLLMGGVYYKSGTLIRGSNKNIYVVTGGSKHHITSLNELRRSYAGRPIYDISDQVLALY